ncbi:hypothetical protein G4177_21160 [Corallococcus sp. ZKHCc1 1396]|uniref:Uncharacterized protein n=1 Tax=Corallococcus soli TaxID=2710757 RepID=A0ABR9PRX5_9BACT|nr:MULTISPECIES: hypothetical protein [Corallococcus]MBE4750683.1 hypothetical protein [Corallococcus soli]MCY1031791.1 hypothetical protein [Corallococcus sp. BB11-1]RYZ34450.1 MAG: hypothetical protein EOO72_13085 [Myxococcaceae bacterium]
MADASWGNCKDCRFFAGNSDEPSDGEVQSCNQPQLKQFALLVSSDSGCNAHEAVTGEAVPIYGEAEPAPSMH